MLLLAILILLLAGGYVCLKREVQVSSKLVIRGRPAVQIGAAMLIGAGLSLILPGICAAMGLVTQFEGTLIISLVVLAGSLGCMAYVALKEKRRQEAADSEGAPPPLVYPVPDEPTKPPPPSVPPGGTNSRF